MDRPDWSRRDLLKTVATGATAVGLGALAVDSMDRYVVGATEPDAAAAAAGLSDARHRRIELGDVTLVSGVYSSATRASFASREDVAFVEPDAMLHAPPPGIEEDPAGDAGGDDASADGQVLPWGIDRVDADVAHDDGETGAGADVAIIDTGIDDAHSDLADALAEAGDGAHKAWTECSGGNCDHPWSDDGDHGSHVSGTVAAADSEEGVVGVAPGATLHALKVCGSSGRCRTSDIAAAIRYAADQGWDVANLSLGSPRPSQSLEAAGEYAAAEGVLLVASAGNAGPNGDVGYPAQYDPYLAVAATTIEDGVAEFSSRGESVDVAAPGKAVCSAVVGGHGSFDGTSMAAPHVAGAAAHLMAGGMSATAARAELEESAEDIGLAGEQTGQGLVDVAAALGLPSDDDGTGDGTSCPP